MKSDNHYEVLGVATDATATEIQAAYRRAAQRFHPDRNPRAAIHFQALAVAYRVLRQPALRRAFDRDIGLGGHWKPWYGSQAPGTIDPAPDLPPEALEQIAIQLAVTHRWPAPRIAARLATLGCSYRSAWELAWQVRHQALNEALGLMIQRETRTRGATAQTQPPPAEGRAHAGQSRPVTSPVPPPAATEVRPPAPAPTSRASPPPSSSALALAEVGPSVWATRIRRLRRVLSGISRLLGFEPPRMAREHRKQLRLAYDRRPRHGGDAR